MIKSEYKIIGVMSGTSLDGMDLVCVTFTYAAGWSYKIIASETIAYDEFWSEILKDLTKKTKDELKIIDIDYTLLLSQNIDNFIKKNNIKNIDAICSHGHTAIHLPEKGVTYQIGNQKQLAQYLRQTVVCDFRVQDVQLGGQGAPLVPIGDELLFSEFDFCLNLGGFSNVSTRKAGKRISYDICPVNIVLNTYALKLGFLFDEDGKLAQSGHLNQTLLEALNGLFYYSKNYPKSLGKEWVDTAVTPIIDSYKIEIIDVLRTFTEHIAIQISKEINDNPCGSVLVTGGGAFNFFLIERIKKYSKNKLIIPDKQLINYKEALIFGFLGVLKLRNEINCLSSVTGSKKDHSSGVVYYP